MRKLWAPAILMSSCLLVPHVNAGWSDLVDKVKDEGGSVLKDSLTSGNNTGSSSSLETSTIIEGLKESLSVGTQRAVAIVSANGGYLNDADIRVPLPNGLDKLSGALRQFGMGDQVDVFENSINRAAEKAAPKAASILSETITNMSFEDARTIYSGGDDAATQYLKDKSGDKIAALFKPEISSALSSVDATRSYDQLAKKAASLPVVGESIDTDLTDYVTNKALDGLFLKLAEQEKAIRENPAARTTELLQTLWK
jgi:hypothetical protein